MLGRLARWLRLLGYDTAYAPEIEDNAILELAEKEGRILLTRDTLLIRRKRCRNCIFIRSDHWREQLQQVYVEARLSAAAAFILCPVCNHKLTSVPKDSVESLVPPYVYTTREIFSRCERCERIYWRATHVRRILDELKALHKEP